jgi:SPX domain protein involved in polyphosphate accumulation
MKTKMRLEYKYLIPVSKFEQVKKEMLPYLQLDEYADRKDKKEYTVRSIYFDNPKWQYYVDKIEGLKVRKKLRIRGYNDSFGESVIFIEIKRKNQGFISKNRAPLLYSDLPKILETGNAKEYIFNSDSKGRSLADAEKFLYYYTNDHLSPTILITYEREPFYYKFDKKLRITFDKDLRFLSFPEYDDLFEEEHLQKALTNKVILEIKFTCSYPSWLQNILTRYDLQRRPVSKYTNCIERDRIINPSNKHKNLAIAGLLETQEINKRRRRHASGF